VNVGVRTKLVGDPGICAGCELRL